MGHGLILTINWRQLNVYGGFAVKQDSLKSILAGKGLRLTRARQDIITAAQAMKGHFDPQNLYDSLKEKGSKASRASVYRSIPVLLEAGIISEAERTDRCTHYEKVTENRHHDHLTCLRCGTTIEFYSPTLEMLQDEICQRENFKGIRHNLDILGYCRECVDK
ncbi:MAG: transcriptional repressor [Syntrophus sp. (in: bacteria)]|nr:transcriptional repressor [Syntrophus sp. (in: bacteria)]